MSKITEDRPMNNGIIDGSYKNLSLDDLIIYAIGNVRQNSEDCTFERLVYECFTLFPKSFSLFRYPQWPDSNKLDRPLRKVRERGLIVGNPKIGFSLTEFGQRTAKEVEKKLFGHNKAQRLTSRPLKGKETNLIAYLKSSELYKRFKKEGDKFTLSKSEVINILRGTLETPTRVLKQNLSYYKRIVSECGETELLEFLTVCEKGIETLTNS